MRKRSVGFGAVATMSCLIAFGGAAAPPAKKDSAARALLEQLRSADAEQRAKAVWELYAVHDRTNPPVGPVAALLDDESPEVRKAVYAGVLKMKGLAKPVAERLLEILKDPKRRAEAEQGFKCFHQDPKFRADRFMIEAGPPLLKAMETAEGDALAWIAKAALDTGIEIPDEVALAAYRKDKERMDAWVVLWGEYCRSTNPEVIALLRQELADGGDGWHLAQAANGLGQIGPAAAAGIPELTAALDSTVPHVRRYAARAIAMIGPAGKTALAKIKDMAQNDANAEVRQWAASAAQTLEVAIAKE